jgi:hypothetical protein
VIAFGRGGALETIRAIEQPRPTGLFFDRQEPGVIAEAVRIFERNSMRISPADCRENATRFSEQVFRDNYSRFVEQCWDEHRGVSPQHRAGLRVGAL